MPSHFQNQIARLNAGFGSGAVLQNPIDQDTLWQSTCRFVFGQVFKFIQSFAPKSITAAPDIEAYLGFVLSMFLAFGLAFEVPIAVVVLARLKVVTIEKLKDFRGYFIVVAFIVAAILTPPDVVSQLALAVPMCILYEIGIWACVLWVKPKKAASEPAASEAE